MCGIKAVFIIKTNTGSGLFFAGVVDVVVVAVAIAVKGRY